MIEYAEHFTKEDSLAALNPKIRKWFEEHFKELTPPQYYSFKLIRSGKNVLITAPTGSGKTFSAFMAILSDLMDLADSGKLEEKVYCIYVSPLRALNNDIYRNLSRPLEEIYKEFDSDRKITVGVRTGDTEQKERQKQLKHPPNILVTTPESLAILLNSSKFSESLRDLKYIVIDELHELANNKRGVHLSLSVERLAELCGHDFIRIGLGATLYPLEEAARFLVGYNNNEERHCYIVDATWDKKMEFTTICPVKDIINSSDEKIENSIYKIIDEIIKKNKTTLIFTNTRSGTERVVFNLMRKFKYSEEEIAAHHGSLSREIRLGVEEMLKKGELKCVVSSTSLELGIDIGYIDNVVQLGSPKSITRAVQRIGRSGHKFYDVAKGEIIVVNRDDLVECSVMLYSAKKKLLDKFSIPKNPLDVLAQHIVGMSLTKKWKVDEAYALVRNAYPYHDLQKSDFISLLEYLSGSYVGLESRRVYGKIWYDEKEGMFGRRGRYTKIIYYLNIGTIPDEVAVDVYEGKRWIGSIEEDFLARLRPGDIFVLGGRLYKFEYARGMRCFVSKAESKYPTIPPWFSEQLPLSYELAIEIGKFRERFAKAVEKALRAKNIHIKSLSATGLASGEIKSILDELPADANAKNSILQYFVEQILFAKYVPNHKFMLIELTKDKRSGISYAIFNSLYGRRINDALSRIFAILIGERYGEDIGVMVSDNGFVLSSPIAIDEDSINEAFKEIFNLDTTRLLKENIRRTEMMKRRFRHCAARSFMVLRNYKGQKISVSKQQFNAQSLLTAAEEINPNFPIIKETYREILEDVMDLPRAKEILKMVESGEIKYRIIKTPVPSPFSHLMLTFGEADIVMMKDRRKRIKELHNQVLKLINKGIR
ncbi:MAG: ATP-dependent helicase [Candidatus Micrarchaeia archaeon]|jgi:ATP-dependent Lhr-like helicase